MNGVLPRDMILTLGLQVHLYTPRKNPERRNLAARLPALPLPALWLSQANSAPRLDFSAASSPGPSPPGSWLSVWEFTSQGCST